MKTTSVIGHLSLKRIVLSIAALAVIGSAGSVVANLSNALAAGAPTSVAATAAGVTAAAAAPQLTMALPDFTQIAARMGPAVVNIRVSGSVKASLDTQERGRGRADPYNDDPFFEFFRRYQGPRGQRDTPVSGMGSGFIVGTDGIILTNAHVVRDAKEVTVKLTDRREFRAKVLGSDPKTDVAVLKIDAHNLTVVPIGKSNELKVGEWVLAIGSPFGLDSTVTAGVVSAKGRSLPDDSNVPFIQTDVAVNPGNSGGPLFNTRGEVVGINSQIYSQSGGYQGLSFAIPIDLATRVKDQIVATGKVAHAKLGVTIQEVNQAFADSFKLDKPEGALVSNIEPGSAADKAGLQTGDVIRKINGQAIVTSGDLSSWVGIATPGEKVKLDVWRDGKQLDVMAKLGDASEKRARAEPEEQVDAKARLGLVLRPLDPSERRQSGIAAGLLVEDVQGAAANAGVQAGDVLVSVNGRAVTNAEQVRAIVAKSDKSVALLIVRGGDRIFIPVRIG